MNSRVLLVLVFTVVSSWAAAIDDTVDVYDLEREIYEERGFRDAVKSLGKKAVPIAKKLLPVLIDQLRSRENIDGERGFKDFMKKVGHGISEGAKKAAPVVKKVYDTIAPVAGPIALKIIDKKIDKM